MQTAFWGDAGREEEWLLLLTDRDRLRWAC